MLFALVITMSNVTMYAQIGIAPEIGFNDPNWSFSASHENIFGVNAGCIIHYDLNERLFLQTGLFYKTQGCSVSDYDWKIKIRSMQTPIFLNYKYCFNAERGFVIYFGGGAYIEKYIGGTLKQSGITTNLKIGNKAMDSFGHGDNIKEYDYGIILQMGGIHPSGLFDRVWYSISTANNDVFSESLKGSVYYSIGATAGYIFGYNRRHNGDDYNGHYNKHHRIRYKHIR